MWPIFVATTLTQTELERLKRMFSCLPVFGLFLISCSFAYEESSSDSRLLPLLSEDSLLSVKANGSELSEFASYSSDAYKSRHT